MRLFTAEYVLVDDELEAEIASDELADGIIPMQIRVRHRQAASVDDLKSELLKCEDKFNAKCNKPQFLRYLCVIDDRGKRILLH